MLRDRIILACTVIVALVYLYSATLIPVLEIGDPLGPKAFPRLLGIALLIAAGMLGLEIWRERGNKADPSAAPPFEGPVIVVLLGVAVWACVYYLVFERLGYIVATVLFLLPLMAWFNRGKWTANIVSTVVFVALTYWLFVKLEVRLPQGLVTFI